MIDELMPFNFFTSRFSRRFDIMSDVAPHVNYDFGYVRCLRNRLSILKRKQYRYNGSIQKRSSKLYSYLAVSAVFVPLLITGAKKRLTVGWKVPGKYTIAGSRV